MYNGIVGEVGWAKAHFFIGSRVRSAVRERVISKVLEIAERVGRSEGVEVLDVELMGGGRRRVLRITIDRTSGVTLDDCERISNQVGTILDVEDVVPGGSYTLEVSSPGVERKLRNARDFERFVGSQIKVTLREPVENRKHWEGKLEAFSEGLATLQPATGSPLAFRLDEVERANLKFDW